MLPVYLLERIHAGPSSLSLSSSAAALRAALLLRRQQLHSSALRLASAPKKSKSGVHAHQSTLQLPKTGFPLRADAVKREKLFWHRTNDQLYEWQSQQAERPLFVLADGPPYANGNLHTGHALNKITKDIINRSKLIQGHRIHYRPGFDTHGLPLELKALSALKKPASSLTPQQIRAAARKEAEAGIATQTAEFRAFAVMGAWGQGSTGEPYKTLEWGYERRQLEVVREMVRRGLIVSHNRPTLYSPSSRTALAEAELEYREDHKSRSVYVAFPLADQGALGEVLSKVGVAVEKVGLAVWTTTAWTLPSNVAVAVSEQMDYSLVRVGSTDQLLVLATARIEALAEILETELATLAAFPGSTLLKTTYTSPLSSPSHEHPPRPIIPASYVTSTTGTGLVHTAPAHGAEDFEAWRAYQSAAAAPGATPADVVCAVDGEGKISSAVWSMVEPSVAERLLGKEVLGDGTGEVISILTERGTLLREVAVEHKFPYDWRTKKPVIFRASNQWFANLEQIKQDAIEAVSEVQFHPPRGKQTLEMFVRGRSEWCISRQRAWGVPLPIVYSYPAGSTDPIAEGKPYLSPSNIDHIVAVLEKNGGTDYWWDGPPEEFVEPAELARAREDGRVWRKGTDTMDVWFDSGCSWTLLREEGVRAEGGPAPLADVYLEGSDQHRGWFQSSLLTKISATEAGAKPQAPYGAVITHGMVLDDKGRKMSKSLGNVLSPFTVINGGKNHKQEPAYGTDLLRVWVASVDWTRDVLIGPAILAQTSEALRKMRNTARFMLGNLQGAPTGAQAPSFAPDELGLVELFLMHELKMLDCAAREGYNTFAFNKVYQALSTFSNSTLSSFYFDIIKDSLYADALDSPARQRVVFILGQVLETYTKILAPMAPLLAEEINHFRSAAKDPANDSTVRASSVFEQVWRPVEDVWQSEAVAREMAELVAVREEVMSLLERARNDKLVGSSTEAEVWIANPSQLLRKHEKELARLFIVADVHLGEAAPRESSAWSLSSGDESEVAKLGVSVGPSSKLKCSRCWTYSRPAADQTDNELCQRCDSVLAHSH